MTMTTVMVVMVTMVMTIVFTDWKSALRQFEAFVKSMDSDSRLIASVEIPGLLLSSPVTGDKFLNLTQFPHLRSGDNQSSYLIGVL